METIKSAASVADFILTMGTIYGQEKYIKKIKKIVELYLKKLYEY
ncbi:hypothetical protein [Desulfobacter latus]|nr:hypothetical protein [Desulfobacter latus]